MSGPNEAQYSAAWLFARFLPARGEAAEDAPPSRGVLGGAVRGLERVIRYTHDIYEFTPDKDCILRVGRAVAEDELALGDGTQIRPGEPILELHFWNEHLPAIPEDGPCIAWGRLMHERVLRSMRLLARHLQSDERCRDIAALRGEAAFASRLGRSQMLRVARRYGFELFEGRRPVGRRFRFFWENFFVWGLIWTFNRGGLRGKRLIRERFELWISRQELIRRYGGAP
ncbi:MAG: hypothetical protein JO010_06245 [Alphaproteobacteria bacterium]|nr:hypothetical protein [Alphaproteobacteria bacterium]